MPTYRATDDRCRKSMTLIRGFVFLHRLCLRNCLANVTKPTLFLAVANGQDFYMLPLPAMPINRPVSPNPTNNTAPIGHQKMSEPVRFRSDVRLASAQDPK